MRELHGIASLPLDELSALHLMRVPALQRDPFDRMLVSQALVHGLLLLTPDEQIRRYPVRCVW
jgi:PIN domain nuclease of toxin-antitoxin system